MLQVHENKISRGKLSGGTAKRGRKMVLDQI